MKSRNVQRAERILAEDFGTANRDNRPDDHGRHPDADEDDDDVLSHSASTTTTATTAVTASRRESKRDDGPAAPMAVLHDVPNAASAAASTSSAASAPASPASAIPSFTSDSPYLQSYIDKEMRNLVVLTDTLRDISARARTFGKCGALMAEATRRLSGACRLNPPNGVNGPSNGGGETSGGNGNTKGRNGGNASSGSGNSEGAKEELSPEYEEQMRIMKERRESVGEEMASVLAVLGEVRLLLFLS